MQTTKRPIAIGYLRVSTDKQGRSGLGLAAQERMIRAFCEARGLTLEADYTEVESGKNDERPQLATAIARAKRRGGLLVIATLSRLGRDVHFVSGLMKVATKNSVPFACADSPDDDPLILHIKAAVAEDEARKISERTKAALAIAKARGKKLGTPANLSHDDRKRGAATRMAQGAAARDTIRGEVMAARSAGLSVRAIAERVGCSPMTVSRVLRASA